MGGSVKSGSVANSAGVSGGRPDGLRVVEKGIPQVGKVPQQEGLEDGQPEKKK